MVQYKTKPKRLTIPTKQLYKYFYRANVYKDLFPAVAMDFNEQTATL